MSQSDLDELYLEIKDDIRKLKIKWDKLEAKNKKWKI